MSGFKVRFMRLSGCRVSILCRVQQGCDGEVLSGVASEYLLNVGRTIQYLSNKYAKKMTPEVCSFLHLSLFIEIPHEITPHTLFESGITRAVDLERYIQDDVVRYGGRIVELEKKLQNAYHEAVNQFPALT